MSELWQRLCVLFRRDTFDRDLEEEMRAHLEMQVEENRENGMPAEEARYAARRQFGNATALAEKSRDAWGWAAIERFAGDVRFALRMLARNPGFTAAAALTLGLGVGANSAVFSLVDAFLFRPVAVPDAGRLASIADRIPSRAGRPISFPNFLDWQRENRVFERMAAYRSWSFVFADEAGADRAPGMEVSAGFFEILGMRPLLGRIFTPEEHRYGGAPAAIISHELWQRRFAGDAAILGRVISINGGVRTQIVGVTPPGFRVGPRAEIYTPLELARREDRGAANSLYAVGRLKSGVSWEQARSEMDAIAARLEQLYPNTNKGHRVDLIPFGRLRRGEIRPYLLQLLGAVGMILLIACANISNLLLAKAAGRGREIAMRKALGASRARLIAQLLTESLALSALGGAAGLLFGYWGCRGLLALAGDLNDWPGGAPLGGIGLDSRVFAYTLSAALLAGIVMGLAPALHASKASLAGRGITRESRRTFDVLAASEVALALVLLSGAGLLLRSLYHLMTQNRGFESSHVLTFSLAPAQGRETKEACERILAAIQTIPGVEAVAGAFPLPFGHGYSGDDMWPEERIPGREEPLDIRVRYVTPGYFRTLGIPLLQGRGGAASDNEQAAVVNDVLVREAWQGRNPLGRRFRLGAPAADHPPITVVGVVRATRENGLETQPPPEVYLPVSGRADILVRTSGDPLAMLPAIRARIHTVDRSQHIYDAFPLEERISGSVRGNRIFATLLGGFAVLAALLAAVGIYAVIAHSVNRRTQEFGIRMAMGASPADVRRLVLRQGMARVSAGLLAGTAAAVALTRLLESMLYGVKPADPLTIAAAAALLGAAALAACYLPARRATRIDPIEALRHE